MNDQEYLERAREKNKVGITRMKVNGRWIEGPMRVPHWGYLVHQICKEGRFGALLLLIQQEREGMLDRILDDGITFGLAAQSGHAEMVQWFLKRPNLEIHGEMRYVSEQDWHWRGPEERPFRWAITAQPTSLPILKLIWTNALERGSPIDLLVQQNGLFIKACQLGNLPVVQYLYSLELTGSYHRSLGQARHDAPPHIVQWIDQILRSPVPKL